LIHARTLSAAAALLAATIAAASARDLTVVSRGEALNDATRKVFAIPFAGAAAIPTQTESWDGGLDALHGQAKGADSVWDVVQVDADELATGCNDGSLERLDWSAIGGREHYLPQATFDCGVGAMVNTLVLAWDRDKFPGTPSWADFWDVAKYPGKRALPHSARGNLEIALMADGVAPGDVYKTLASPDGVDRAFRKLDQLRPYLAFWQDGAEATHMLVSGDVLMTSAPADRVAAANRSDHRNFGTQWTGSLYEFLCWALLHGTANARQAVQFLYFAGTPAIQGQLVAVAGTGGLAKGANDLLPPDIAALSPSNPVNLTAGLHIDSGFWHDNQARLSQRFDAWLAH
jgi:putative spermidine/putrescine transport system substrate-binding protein